MHCSDMVELCRNDHHSHLLDSGDGGIEQHSVLVSKAEETLVKTDDEASIRNSVRQWEQKKSSIRYPDI